MKINFLDENPDLNITPLVDIMLVLMAILMVAMPTLTYEENINVPVGSKQNVVAKNTNTLKIQVYSKDKIMINNIPTKLNEFKDTFVNQTSDFDKQTKILLSIDKTLTYGDAVFIITSVTQSGFSNISLITK